MESSSGAEENFQLDSTDSTVDKPNRGSSSQTDLFSHHVLLRAANIDVNRFCAMLSSWGRVHSIRLSNKIYLSTEIPWNRTDFFCGWSLNYLGEITPKAGAPWFSRFRIFLSVARWWKWSAERETTVIMVPWYGVLDQLAIQGWNDVLSVGLESTWFAQLYFKREFENHCWEILTNEQRKRDQIDSFQNNGDDRSTNNNWILDKNNNNKEKQWERESCRLTQGWRKEKHPWFSWIDNEYQQSRRREDSGFPWGMFLGFNGFDCRDGTIDWRDKTHKTDAIFDRERDGRFSFVS